MKKGKDEIKHVTKTKTLFGWTGPLPAKHPLVSDSAKKCVHCKNRFLEGDIVGELVIYHPVRYHETGRAVIHKKCLKPYEETL